MIVAQIIVYTALAYLAIGFLFSVYFSFFAVKKFDESAKDAGIGFRLIIFFGVVAFWTLLAWRLFRGQKRPIENDRPPKNSPGGKLKMIRSIRKEHKFIWILSGDLTARSVYRRNRLPACRTRQRNNSADRKKSGIKYLKSGI